jgi:hypothetical protein
MSETTKIYNHDDRPIWGAAAIAREAGLPDRASVYHLLKAGHLLGRKVGRRWVSTPAQIRGALIGNRSGGGRD